MERSHEQLAGPLAERMLGRERDELSQAVARVTVPTESCEGDEPLLARGDRQLAEARRLDAPCVGLRQLFVGLPAPEGKRFVEQRERPTRVARAFGDRVGDELREAVRVDVVRSRGEAVTGADGLDRSLGQHTSEPEDVGLQRGRLIGRQPVGPEQLGETVGADHRAALEHESREQAALPVSRRREVSVAVGDPEGSKDPVAHCPPSRSDTPVSGSPIVPRDRRRVHPDRMLPVAVRHGRLTR